jgi:hypothetical protein
MGFKNEHDGFKNAPGDKKSEIILLFTDIIE